MALPALPASFSGLRAILPTRECWDGGAGGVMSGSGAVPGSRETGGRAADDAGERDASSAVEMLMRGTSDDMVRDVEEDGDAAVCVRAIGLKQQPVMDAVHGQTGRRAIISQPGIGDALGQASTHRPPGD